MVTVIGLKKVTLFFSSLFVAGLVLAGEDFQAVGIGPFSGVNNRDSSFAIPAQNAQDALNVNVTPGGKSVFKRKGYGITFNLPVASSPVHGVYTFFDALGNTVDLYANDSYLTSSIAGAPLVTLFSNGPTGATYQCTDSLGFAYCVNSARSALTKTNGVTVTSLNGVVSKGTTIATCVTRLAMAGFSDRPSGIDFSADSDFTTWGTGGLGSSPVELTISAPGARITHITYAFGRLMWFKDSSFGYVLIGNQPAQTDWVIRTVSYDVGTNDNSSIYREGILYFRGQDGHIYAFDGSTYQRLSREIAKSIFTSQIKTANSWNQTTQSDFQAGDSTPTGYINLTISPGAVQLDTATAPASFVDTTASDFGAGSSFVNVDTTTSPGDILLAKGGVASFISNTVSVSSEVIGNGGTCPSSNSQYQKILATQTFFVSSITVRVQRDSAYSGNLNVGFNNVSGTILNASIGTSQTDAVVNISTTLIAGTTYTLTLSPTSLSDNTKGLYWFYGTSGSPYSLNASSNTLETKNCPSSCSCGSTWTQYTRYDVNTRQYAFNIFGSSYASSGSFLSRTFDVGFTTTTWIFGWSTFTASYEVTAGVRSISFQTQTSSSANGPFTGFLGVSSGAITPGIVQEFIRYQANLATVDLSTSPILSGVSIPLTSLIRPSATFYSQVHNAPNITSWDTIGINSNNNGGLQTFSVRASTMNFSVLSSTPAWTTIANGQQPSISTGTYFQFADQFQSFTSTTNPILYDFTFNWFEGAASDKFYGTYYDDKLWFSVNVGSSVVTNNRILVYDMLNQTWLLYDLPCNGFLVRQNKLYFGDSTQGNIYKFGDIDNDNGSAINAYWKSKDFFGGSPFAPQEIANISIVAKEINTSSMTVTYSINGSSDVSYVVPLYVPNSLFMNKNKNIPAGTIAGDFNVKFGNNAVDQPFEVYGVQVGIRPKTWIPN